MSTALRRGFILTCLPIRPFEIIRGLFLGIAFILSIPIYAFFLGDFPPVPPGFLPRRAQVFENMGAIVGVWSMVVLLLMMVHWRFMKKSLSVVSEILIISSLWGVWMAFLIIGFILQDQLYPIPDYFQDLKGINRCQFDSPSRDAQRCHSLIVTSEIPIGIVVILFAYLVMLLISSIIIHRRGDPIWTQPAKSAFSSWEPNWGRRSSPVYPRNRNGTIPMYLPPAQPPGHFAQSTHYYGRGEPWTTAPALPNPAFSPPQELSYPPPPSNTYPHSPYSTTLPSPKSSPNFPSLLPAPHPISGSQSTSPPRVISERPPINPSSDQMNLMDRMREVQVLMLEIHRLDSDPGANNRSRIQELQRRVTELSDTQNPNVATSGRVLGPPPAFAQDGRDPA